MHNIQAYSVLYNNTVHSVRVDILLTSGKPLHARINSLRGEIWAHKTSLTPPFLLKCLYQARKVSSHLFVY